MSNSIWKTPDQKPEDDQHILFFVDGYLYSGYYEPQYNQYGIFGASKIEKWCYMRELSSYILALETELERTRKALDKAERLQKAVDNYEKVIVGAMFAPDVGDVTAGMLEESHKTIKQLIKG